MANRADYKRDPQADVWDMLARLKETVDKLAADVEEMRLREFVDQPARDDITALTTRVAALTTRVAALEADTVAWSEITGKPATFPPSLHDNTAHSVAYLSDIPLHDNAKHSVAYLSDIPLHGNEKHTSTFITGVSWDAVTGKPSTFTPAIHSNEAHNPDFALQISLETVDNAWQAQTTYMKGQYNPHTHTETGTTTGSPSPSM